MYRRGLALVCAGVVAAGVVAAWARTARAQDADGDARVHFRVGRAYYDSGRFNEAATEFEQAYRLSNRSELLYNVFVAHRDAGHMVQAADALARYLDLVPDAPDREQLRARLASMQRLVVEQQQASTARATPAPAPAVSPVAAPPQQPSTSRATVPRERPAPASPVAVAAREPRGSRTPGRGATRNRTEREESGGSALPWILAGSGGALVATGVVVGLLAAGKQADLEEACGPDLVCPPELEGEASTGQTMAIAADALIAGGVVSAGIGVAMLLLSGGDEPAEGRPAAAAFCDPSGCGAAMRISF